MKRHNGAPAPKAEVRKKEVRSFVAGKSLQIRKSADGKMTLEGYAIRFGKPSQDLGGFIEYIDGKALNRTLKENPDVLLLRDHNQSLLLARTTAGNLKLSVDAKGLKFSADLLDTTTATDAYKDIKAGLLTGMSFGFYAVDDSWQQVNGTLVRTVLDLDLFEISATSFPAYQSTEVDARSVRSKLGDSIPILAKRDDLDDSGLDDLDCDGQDADDPECEDRCECRCAECRADNCKKCSAEDCADKQCAADGCQYAGVVETMRLRIRLAKRHRPIQS